MFNLNQQFPKVKKRIFPRIIATTLCTAMFSLELLAGSFSSGLATKVEAATPTPIGGTNSYINADITASSTWGKQAYGVRIYASEHGTYNSNTTQTSHNANFLIYKDKELVAIFSQCSTLPDLPHQPSYDAPDGVDTIYPAAILAGEYNLTRRASSKNNSTYVYDVSASSGYYWNGGSGFNTYKVEGILVHSSTGKASPNGNPWSTGCLTIKEAEKNKPINFNTFVSYVGTSAKIKVVRDSNTNISTSPSTGSYSMSYQVSPTSSTNFYSNVSAASEYAGAFGNSIDKVYMSMTNADIWYSVKLKNGTILKEVKNRTDYAGIENNEIIGIAVRASVPIKYRVHLKGGSWLPWVTDCNWNSSSGYAGSGTTPIDAIQVNLQ